ncbi:MAG: hypothetical protein M3O71_25815 [Bacteroidota bacterium]|nr:hypothetical protein [Bacteroidota bacterium]
MEEEFKRSIYWKLFYIALSAGFAIFMIVLAISNGFRGNPLLILFPLLSSAFAVLVIVSQVISKIVISADHIVKTNILGRRELLTQNVKGVRIAEKYISIEPLSPAYTKIKINNYIDYPDSEDLTSWLRENFTDLDAEDLKENEARVLSDPQLGFTQEEREENLSKAKKIAMAYNIAGLPVGFAVMFIDKLAVIILALIYPLVGILVMKFSKGLIKFLSNRKRSVNPSVMMGFYIPALFLFFKSMFNYDIANYEHLWLIAGVITLTILLLLYTTGINKTAEAVKGQIIFMLVLSCFYGFGSTMTINCGLDSSAPKSIQTTVNDKYSEYNKRMHYHFKLTAWDGDPSPKNVEVSLSRFNRYKQGDTITVYLRPGTLSIPWFTLYK